MALVYNWQIPFVSSADFESHQGMRDASESTRDHEAHAHEAFAPDEQTLDPPSAAEPDWSRERCAPGEWRPSRQLLRALRDYTAARERGGLSGLAARKLATARHRFWSIVTGADIPLNSSRIAGGLLIPHPNGVVIHPEAVIGPNCLIFQQVTIGTGPRPGVPKLGGNVDVGPGAKVLGGVTIGDHAVIGANAVVLNDVPAGAVAVGVPAMPKKLLSRRRDR